MYINKFCFLNYFFECLQRTPPSRRQRHLYKYEFLSFLFMNVFSVLNAEEAAIKASKAEEQRLRAMIASGSETERCFRV
jgi:hypothetical protein